MIGAAAKSLQGDCYVNLDKLGEALGCYDKAIKISDENPLYTPYFMMKKATVLREQKNYSAEAAVYREIIKDYPMYGAQNGIEMEKYLKRAELQAEAKQVIRCQKKFGVSEIIVIFASVFLPEAAHQ